MPEKEISREELKLLKRQAAIQQREQEAEKKRQDLQEQKRRELEQIKADYENQEKARIEERLKFLKKQAEARAKKKARTAELNRKREEKIASRREAWERRANEDIFAIKELQEEEELRACMRLDEVRERKRQEKQAFRDEEARRLDAVAEREMRRAQMNTSREAERDIRSIRKVDALKTEATEELESFILDPHPIPLKQVLAGRMRPVPTVSELLAAYKDQREDLKELEEMDIPTRAMLRNQTLFQYVRDIQLKAEADRIRPPMPQAADLGRSRNRSSHPRRAARSPKGARS